jgi:hypothetical protein
MSRRWFLSLILAVLVPAAAGAKFDADTAARALAPFLDDRTVLVGHVDLTRVDLDKVFARLKEFIPDKTDKESEQIQKAGKEWLAGFQKAGGSEVYLVFSLVDLFEGPFLVAPVKDAAAGKATAAFLMRQASKGHGTAVLDNTVYFGPSAALKRIQDRKPADRPEAAKALAAAGDEAVLRLALIPNADSRRVFEETLPTLPAEFGGGSTTPFTRGLQWAVLGLHAPPEMKLMLTLQASSAKAAETLYESIQRVVKAVQEHKEFKDIPYLDKLKTVLTLDRADDRVMLSVADKDLLPVIAGLMQKVRADLVRGESRNQLRQIGLALWSYHDVHKQFPAAASYDKGGKPLLSWRVHLLPFLDQEALYKEFRLDEPWDSDHNKKLIARMPAVYRSSEDPKVIAAGKTSYLAPLGEATMFPGKEGVRVRDVTDGTSNTIFIVDADDAHAVEWTKPEDLPIDSKAPRKGLSKRHDETYLTLFVDGSVHGLPAKIKDTMLYALFTRAGGEVVQIP